MDAYVDYTFYTDIYGGDMNEAAFNRAALSASQYIRSVTMNKSDDYEGDEMKYATCELADIYGNVAQTSTGGTYAQPGKEVRSVSNAGFSVTYTAEGADGETSEALINRKAYAALRKWLLPTGLLNPKVGWQCEEG